MLDDGARRLNRHLAVIDFWLRQVKRLLRYLRPEELEACEMISVSLKDKIDGIFKISLR